MVGKGGDYTIGVWVRRDTPLLWKAIFMEDNPKSIHGKTHLQIW